MRKYYYWLVTHDENGKVFLIFGGEDESQSRQKGLEMLSGMDFDIKRLPTRDLATASAMYRGKRLERGEGLRRSTQRLGHDRSLDRLRRRRMVREQ